MRYVLEQGLVPAQVVTPGTGNHRSFTDRQALLVATACMLHEQGFRGPVVQEILTVVAKDWRSDTIRMSRDTFGVNVDLATIRGKINGQVEGSGRGA